MGAEASTIRIVADWPGEKSVIRQGLSAFLTQASEVGRLRPRANGMSGDPLKNQTGHRAICASAGATIKRWSLPDISYSTARLPLLSLPAHLPRIGAPP
jgi:hypothetical protein